MEPVSFAGRVAIVTGAGGGIGRSYALELARRGARVVANDLGCDVAGRGGSVSMAESVAAQIRQAGGDAIASCDSVATTAGAEAIVARAMSEFGRIDVLINNAGTMRNTFFEDVTDEDWDALIGTHLTGSFKMTRAVWPHMKAQGYGRIVFTSSSAGLFGTPMVGAYAPAKAGILGLMNLVAHEGRVHGIHANAIMPNAASRMAMQAGEDWARHDPSIALDLPEGVGNAMNVEFNMALGVWLASEACTETRGLFSQCLGRNARVFLGVSPGWQAQRQSAPSVEDIAAHWAAIAQFPAGLEVPSSPGEELAMVLGAPGASA